MNVDLFDYDLPESLIAQTPLANRTGSRLMTLNKRTGEVGHHQFEELADYVQAGDLLVLNDTRVIPARLFGCKPETGGKAELLLLKPLGEDRWEVLIKPGKRFRTGATIVFGTGDDGEGAEGGSAADPDNRTAPLLTAVVEEEREMGGRVVRFSYTGIFQEILDRLGQMPLPPYIKERLDDKERYQTVYARHEGSAAAPTAGLHFTEDFLRRLQDKGVRLAYVTLHVGLGTFRPVSADKVEEHEMHAEYFELSQETADLINRTRAEGGRIVAIGTTSARTLESVARISQDDASLPAGTIKAASGWTDIFLYPGVPILLVDALLTNFHLPKSTLLMLISALAGRENVLNAYRQAVEAKYRFFSFGDAMFIYGE
ncbi:S-adenosylmethionine:tRNA ribosyltransferase-isomerase [Paenibacillus sp. J31TS4]|uniref:tRNA preQ1(34) S-adenosylmethionine ribosyltransferase-isomerase QueA n=1 Tax=Paenibacillus sp. J31TS4 TaxID=2807195 RepID=UPI001B28B50B|nr:tRNA preQ1(34) S-adenosylmethionine ribosyltransferase-isomerase QueA [Paenibacillus sp. J31TS4]GIP39223.1 S-adenosylmethionine:tRNA ribosyltransferase-isomerase [Paenibacillus sp. J31TS4]